MSLVSDRARVLRTYPLGETSLIVQIHAREHGLLRAVAKGARDSKSRFRGLLEPGTALDLVIYLKEKQGLHLIKEISLAGRMPPVSARLESLALRLAGLELVGQTAQDGEALEGLFDLLEDYLSIFEEVGEDGFMPFFSLESSLLELHGILPSLEDCALSGRSLSGKAIKFLPGEGAFVLASEEAEGMDLAQPDLDCLVSLFQNDPSGLRGRSMEPGLRRRMGRILHLTLSRHLPGYRLPRSLEMLRPVGAKKGRESKS
jgi:DNA repair protein RecO (recombination protein O)